MVPRKQAGHMTCTRPQAERQILLAMRASSTHGPKPAILHAHPVEVRAAFRRSSPLAQLINLRQLRNHLTFVVLVPPMDRKTDKLADLALVATALSAGALTISFSLLVSLYFQ